MITRDEKVEMLRREARMLLYIADKLEEQLPEHPSDDLIERLEFFARRTWGKVTGA